ncbi:MAG: VWA domain-containing protein, partial [Myxococcales bacterium]|nr:VWA domain-containing protein [Myxococcales bacterium]
PDPRTAEVRLGIDRATADGDWTVMWAVDEAPLGLRLLTHRDDDAAGGWFALIGNPTGGDGAAPIAKDVVLALDTSGSMRGEKMEQARLAVEAVLDRLGPQDRFDIVAFGTEVRTFAGRPVARDPQTVERARGFVEELVAFGRTNIADALDAALADPAPDRPRIVLFLTDGTPTAGLLEPEKIVDGLPKRGEGQARIFAFGVGHDVNTHLLDSIAERTGGDTTYVDPGEAIDVKVAALYEGLSHPVLEDVAVDFGDLKVDAVHPMRIPLLFRGQDVFILGRYTGAGRHTLTLRGTVQGKPQQHAVTADFPGGAQPENGFVATLWATRRVGELLRRMRLADGDVDRQKTLAEIVELSRRFGILTEYTAFIADSDAPIDADEANRMASELLVRANQQQSGQWAVRQADNESALRKRTVASTAGNFYRDKQGKTRKGEKVRMMQGRAWYKRDGRWVEAEDGKERKHRRVKKFSKAYMDLVRENADFAEAQRLDGDMTINLGDEQVEVY